MGVPSFLRQPQVLGLVRGIPLDERYLGQRWLPFSDVASDEFICNIETTENPMAPFVSVDAESPRLGEGELIQQVRQSVAFIRYKLSLKESDLRIFEDIAGSALSVVGQMAAERRATIERSIMRISRAVDARVEWLRMQALQGSIAYEDPQVKFSITFPNTYTPTPANLWSDTTLGDPVKDIGDWIYYVGQNGGIEPAVMVMSRRVLWAMGQNTKIQNLWTTLRGSGAAATLTENLVKMLLKQIFDIEIVTYDAKYTTRTISATPTRTVSRFLADNVVLLLPNRPLGSVATSPAPPDFSHTGKYSWTKEEIDPWVVEVGAGINCFPKVDYPMLICHATVL